MGHPHEGKPSMENWKRGAMFAVLVIESYVLWAVEEIPTKKSMRAID
jgi:hypothetical protein